MAPENSDLGQHKRETAFLDNDFVWVRKVLQKVPSVFVVFHRAVLPDCIRALSFSTAIYAAFP